MIPVTIQSRFVVLVLVAALVKGGVRERAVALAWAFPNYLFPMMISEFVCSNWCMTGSLRVQLALFDDLILLSACALAALRADRYWVLWAGSLALLSVLTDAVVLSVPELTYWEFAAADTVWWFLTGAAIAWGVAGAWRGRRAIAGEAVPAADRP
jgi:hypothetical protein